VAVDSQYGAKRRDVAGARVSPRAKGTYSGTVVLTTGAAGTCTIGGTVRKDRDVHGQRVSVRLRLRRDEEPRPGRDSNGTKITNTRP
jgi:hypothetical protein